MLDAKAYLFFLNIDWHVVKMLDNLQRYWSRVDLHAFEVLFFFLLNYRSIIWENFSECLSCCIFEVSVIEIQRYVVSPTSHFWRRFEDSSRSIGHGTARVYRVYIVNATVSKAENLSFIERASFTIEKKLTSMTYRAPRCELDVDKWRVMRMSWICTPVRSR